MPVHECDIVLKLYHKLYSGWYVLDSLKITFPNTLQGLSVKMFHGDNIHFGVL